MPRTDIAEDEPKPLGRPRSVDPMEIVTAMRADDLFASEAARKFGVSRTRINQILSEHAPDLLKRKARTLTNEATAAIQTRQAKDKAETIQALKAHETHVEAATALGLTPSGLYGRMRRLGIVEVGQES